jgi:ATP-dependent DNA helicase RecQ
LRGEVAVRFREDPPETAMRKKSRVRAGTALGTSLSKDSLSDDDRTLWEALRECRRRIAAEQGVPPYVIFHDATLLAMVEHRPKNAQEMLALSGVGRTKFERYGEEFLARLLL